MRGRTQDQGRNRDVLGQASPVDAALIAFLRTGGYAALRDGDRGAQQAAMEAAIRTWLDRGALAEASELDRERVRRLLPKLSDRPPLAPKRPPTTPPVPPPEALILPFPRI
jgi:hypothetical protein